MCLSSVPRRLPSAHVPSTLVTTSPQDPFAHMAELRISTCTMVESMGPKVICLVTRPAPVAAGSPSGMRDPFKSPGKDWKKGSGAVGFEIAKIEAGSPDDGITAVCSLSDVKSNVTELSGSLLAMK